MKKKIKHYLAQPMLLVLIVVLIFFTPQSLYSPGQSQNIGVVVAVGIDKEEDLYEVSLLTFIPKANTTFKETDSVISGKADNIAKALYNAQVAVGRKVGLSHVKTTVLSQEVMREDIASVVDYLSRLASLSSSTVLIGTNGSAKELLTLATDLEDSIGLNIEQLVGFNSEKLFVEETSLEYFYSGFYGREKASVLGFLPVVEEDNSTPSSVFREKDSAGGGTVSDSPSPAGGEQSSSKKYILNDGSAVLIKNGTMVEMLTLDQMNSISLLNGRAKDQIVKIQDAELDGDKHDLSFRIREKNVRTTSTFENGYPVFEADITLGMEIMEVDGNHENLRIRSEYNRLTSEMIDKIDYKLQRDFKGVLDVLRANKADVLDMSNIFFKNNRKEYLEFIKKIDGEDEFINHVNFKLHFTIEPN